MSWNNVIPAELLLSDIPKAAPIENPTVTIPLHLLVDCFISYTLEGHWSVSAASADHPAFAELRKRLGSLGYIDIPPYTCWNGDRVLKRFRFNGIQLEIGNTFYCAAAWHNRKKDMTNA